MQKQTDYSQAVKTKYPEQIVIALAKDKNGKANPVTLGWTMIVSGNPPMMAIAVAKRVMMKVITFIVSSVCFSKLAIASLFRATAWMAGMSFSRDWTSLSMGPSIRNRADENLGASRSRR